MGEAIKIDTINELKIWLEGKFELIRATQTNNSDEIRTLRKTVHDTNNAVGALVILDIPGKLEGLKDEVKSHDAVIEKLVMEQAALKTTMRAAYVAIGIAGAVIGAVVSSALEFYQAFGGAG